MTPMIYSMKLNIRQSQIVSKAVEMSRYVISEASAISRTRLVEDIEIGKLLIGSTSFWLEMIKIESHLVVKC